ncbi:MAG TPA: hypothetical protein DDZ60_13840 [Planktothrix sp. UBA10369]|nr:hypothetical protein [Planktothrix sp. UBA10369]
MLFGNEGADILDGCAGNDTLYGGSGNDSLIGGIGDDLLLGDTGNDTLIGGSGQDIFGLSINSESDLILDFNIGSDSLGLSKGLTFDQLTLNQQGNTAIISLTNTGEELARLNGIDINLISSNQFQIIPI